MKRKKQKDRLCYRIYNVVVKGERQRFLCTRKRGHSGDCAGHQTAEDMVPDDAESVTMQCEGDDVVVRVWLDVESFEKGETEEAPSWVAYAPPPYDWFEAKVSMSREQALEEIEKYLRAFEKENPDVGDQPRCMVCRRRVFGDYISVDLSRYEKDDLIGTTFVEDKADLKKRPNEKMFCLECGGGFAKEQHH